jgi:C1A family cysteine protease
MLEGPNLSYTNPRYGWIPDLPDARDFSYLKLAKAIQPEKLPKQIDLRSHCSSVEDQGPLGSCTAQALVGNLELLKRKHGKKLDFSRLFVYFNERALRHTIKEDSGASIRDGIKTLAKLGVCQEKTWPYTVKKFATQPPVKAFLEATDYQITAYYRLTTLEELKHTLATGYPFVFGFSIYQSIESNTVTHTGIIPLPKEDERLIGGHALMAVGYNDSKKQFIIRNSWGTTWGESGYGYIPYDYLTSPINLASDFWTIRDME